MSATHDKNDETQVIREPTCPDCLAKKGEPVLLRARTRHLHLTKAEEIWKVTGGSKQEKFRHAADKTGLLNTYKLASSIRCSFPDKTLHKEGLIIRTLCGKVINVGRDCGRNYIIGLDKVIEYADELGKQEQIRNNLVDARKSLVADAKKADELTSQLRAFKKHVDERTPELGIFLQKRADAKDPKVNEEIEEAFFRDGEVVKRRVIVTGVLVGLTLWADDLPVSLLKDAEALVEQIHARLANTAEDRVSERVLSQKVDALRRKMEAQKAWNGEAKRFLGAVNLKRAVRAAKMRQRVWYQGSELVYRDRNNGNVLMGITLESLHRIRDQELQKRLAE